MKINPAEWYEECHKVSRAVAHIKNLPCRCTGEGVGTPGGCSRCGALNELSTFGLDFEARRTDLSTRYITEQMDKISKIVIAWDEKSKIELMEKLWALIPGYQAIKSRKAEDK